MTAYLGIKRDDARRLALKVGNYSLGGGGFQSRMMDEIRDKRGLSYGAYSYFLPMQQTGPFISSLSTKNEKVEEAFTVSKEVIDDFLKTGPTDKELELAKKNITGGFPLTIIPTRNWSVHWQQSVFILYPSIISIPILNGRCAGRKEVTRAMQSVLGAANRVTVIVGEGQ